MSPSGSPRPATAIILAGGRGTRLGALTDHTPKPLVEVSGRPFIFHVLDYLARQGVRRVVLATGYLGHVFEQVVGACYDGIEVRYSREDQPLGTGGAIVRAFRSIDDPAAYVLNGDTYFPVDLAALAAAHTTASANLTMVLRQVPDVSRFGHVTCAGHHVQRMHEKGSAGPGAINGGLYLIQRAALLRDAPGESFSLERDLLPGWIAQGVVAAMPSEAYMIDIGVPADLERAQHDLSRHP